MKQTIGLLLIILLPHLSIAQARITISGNVKDIKTGEVLIGATVYITNEKKGTTSYSAQATTTSHECL